MTAFDVAYSFVRKWEGGDSLPRPGDPHPTSRGITQDTYDRLARDYGWRPDPVFDLTDHEVEACYYALWQECEAAAFPDLVAVAYFDAVVNLGQRQAVRLLQRAAGVGVDGILGPKTKAAVQAADPRELVIRLLGSRVSFYRNLAADRPEKARFLGGWLQRVHDLERTLALR